MTTIVTGGDGRKTDFRSAFNLLAWVLLLPIALIALGAWENQRNDESLTSATQDAAGISSTLDQVKDISKTDPMTILTFEGTGGQETHLSALVAVSQLQDALWEANEHLEISRIRQPLGWVTIGGAVLAFVGGALGLVTATISGMRARRSQRQLIRSFHRLRSILPFILAVVVVGFCIGVVAAIAFEAMGIGLSSELSSGGVKLVAGAVVLVAVALYSAFMALRGLRDVFALFKPEPLSISGRVVGEAEAPGLWRFVRTLAGRQRALLPDTIIVGLTEGFFVTESQVRLWPEDKLLSGRTLYLPAPYLDLLDEAEIATILGHEFAHFSGEDTLYSQQFTPIYAGLWRALGALRRSDGGRFVLYPAVKLGFHAIERFDHAVGHWSRLREFDADRNGAVLGTPSDAASALIRTGVIAPAVTHILNGAHGAPDDGDWSDLVARTTALVRADGWVDPVPLLQDRQPHPTDSHPPTIRRITALGVEVDDSLLARATRRPEPDAPSFVPGLFADWDGLCRSLSQDFTDSARKAHANRRTALEKAVAQVAGETVVYDNVKPMIWTMGIIAAVLLGFGGFVLFFPDQTGIGHDEFAQTLIATIVGIGTIACALYAAVLYAGRSKPLMVLTPDGLMSSKLDRALAWTDIADFRVDATRRFALRLALRRNADLPKKHWRALYSKVDAKQHVITIGALGIRGMKPAAFSELVGRYHYAAYARQELTATRPEGSEA